MKKLILFLLVGISFHSNAQNLESSFFSLNQISGDKSKIRAKSPTEIVSTSFSSENGVEVFTFLKDADTMIYATVPYGYRINDFVVLDNCIFFCGKNILDSCGYIGIFDVNISTMNIGGYKFVDIPTTVELTKIVAYNNNDLSDEYGAVAIGKPQNNNFKSSVVDLNNYLNNNSWSYTIGFTKTDYITDIALMTDEYNNGEISTVGQSIVSNSNISEPIVYSKTMYIRNYKKADVLGSGMENSLHVYSYTNLRMSLDSPFKMHKLANNKVAVSTIAQYSILQQNNPSYGIEVKTIDLYSMQIENIQFINNCSGTFKEMAYFPTANKLGVLKRNTNGMDEIFLFDMSQITSYTSSKIYHNNAYLNSISCYDGTHFLATSLERNLITSRLSLLQGDINDFFTSECANVGATQISSSNTSISPNNIVTNVFDKQVYLVNFEYVSKSTYKTSVKVKCINYYK